MKAVGIGVFLILTMAVNMSSAQVEDDTKSVFWSSRALYGVKVKLDENFTFSFWRADYLGSGPEYKVDSDPFVYKGWDMTPGFSYSYGELFAGVKLSFGADLYILYRNLQKDTEWWSEYRPRFNLFLTKPLPFGGFVQLGKRWERRLATKWKWKEY